MAIAHCSHWLIALKRLLLLIVTKLVGWASKPGNCQKFELTTSTDKDEYLNLYQVEVMVRIPSHSEVKPHPPFTLGNF
jgi:hypothetical protein